MTALVRRGLSVVPAVALAASMAHVPLAAQTPTPAAAAQSEEQAAAEPATEAVEAQPEEPVVIFRRPIVRVGEDLVLGANTEAREVVVVFGSLRLEGRVDRDVFVWLGDAELGPTAVVDGSLIVVAGNATIAPGAALGRDLVVVGGALDAPPDFATDGDQVIIGAPGIVGGIRGLVPWIMRGLLLGRPVVPDLAWVWTVLGITFVVSLVLLLLFGQAVRSSSEAVTTRPLRAFLTGMLVLVVSGPLIVILAASVVGLVVVPVVFFALLAAWTIGKVGVACGIGQRIVPESDPESRLQAVRSLVIGFVLVVLAYMVPVLGFVTWSLVSVLGLGAATIATMAAIRREYPRKPHPPAAAPAIGSPAALPDGGPGPVDEPAGSAALESGAEPAASLTEAGPAAPPTGLLRMPRAQFLERTAAFAIDCVLIAIVTRLIDSRQDGMFVFLLLGYHVAFWAWQGTTLGGIIIGLRIVRTDGDDLRFVDALVRGLAGVFSIAVVAIGCLWMLFDPERQTWHDKIAGTYVVKVPRDYPLR